jgi:hypothetical protein
VDAFHRAVLLVEFLTKTLDNGFQVRDVAPPELGHRSSLVKVKNMYGSPYVSTIASRSYNCA